ncbi:cobalamin-dependent protein [uncultured Thiodictyon sp.]|uniref:cobalamin B12-binding domain-containing protein n=1 Tax=uncultured Thiodictyon sp. TaxID=1846217 RepID=UPI0025F43090|nr:cobalamin-dependent protein [uncultured Thiodictyon sp.]
MATETPRAPDQTLADLYPEFLAALLAGDRRRCEALTDQCLGAQVPILALYQQLFQRALYQVGEEWQYNRISVGRERLATAIVEGLLNRLYPRVITPQRSGRRIIVGSVEGELHQVGAKMVCDVFEMHGWEAIYLGADTPTTELLRTVLDLRPDAVGLSLSVYFHLGALLTALARLRGAHPELPILIGGQGLRQIGPTLSDDRKVHYAADLDALERLVKRLPVTDPPPEGSAAHGQIRA